MVVFKKFKKRNKNLVDFSEINSNEKAIKLAEKGILVPLYLMPLRFNGKESVRNRLFVPPFVAELKDKYDDIVENLLLQDKVNGYSCKPEYRGLSFIPYKIQIMAKKDGEPIFTETINIW